MTNTTHLSAVWSAAVVGLDVNCNGQKGLGDTEVGWSDSGLEHNNRLSSRISIDKKKSILLAIKYFSVMRIKV